ncbi:MAG: twin-arginine translocase subunit TatC [Candidatus Omnitrophica bacterium]|nr:twin-arginine translocase subunit TatC [Candidatus Omnitrophota bacterium]
MSELYPPESLRMGFVGHLEELRRRILLSLAGYVLVCCVLFGYGRVLLRWLELPAHGLLPELVFLSPTEAFSAYVQVVLLAALIFSFPFFLYQLWAFLAPALSASLRRVILAWLLFAVVCFAGGLAFTFLILLPAALNFLLNFGVGIARPVISLSKYVSFVSVFLLMGGMVFEIPVLVGMLTEAGVIDSQRLRAGRRYAILFNITAAAILTPTQDVVNLLLFSAPMIVLYEIGILLAMWVERRRAQRNLREGVADDK